MRPLRETIAIIIALASLCMPACADENDSESREYPIIAAYIYNFTQFTTWPSNAPSGRFSLCVLGNNPFGELLTPLKNKTARGNNFTLHYLTGPATLSASCDVIFITQSESDHVKTLVSAIKNAPILTISNIEGFAQTGGMVELYKEDTKIGIRINNQAVQNAGLAISSKLLSLAHIVSSQ